MKTLLIAHARNAIHFLLLIALLSIAGEMGRPYAYAALKEREHAQICSDLIMFRARHNVMLPDQPLFGEVLPPGCVKKAE